MTRTRPPERRRDGGGVDGGLARPYGVGSQVAAAAAAAEGPAVGPGRYENNTLRCIFRRVLRPR